MVQVRDQAIRDKLDQRSIQGMANKLWRFLARSFWGDFGQFDLWTKYKTAAGELERFFEMIFQTMHAPETSNYTLAKELFVDILQYEKEYRDFIKSFKCLRYDDRPIIYSTFPLTLSAGITSQSLDSSSQLTSQRRLDTALPGQRNCLRKCVPYKDVWL